MIDKQEHMKDCIRHCWDCRHECQETFFHHCLQEGGQHVEQDHVLVMMDCIQICQTAADFMTRGSDMHAAVCAACADVCDACADSCDRIGSEQMRRCAEMCRECARSCREMSGSMAGVGQPSEHSHHSTRPI